MDNTNFWWYDRDLYIDGSFEWWMFPFFKIRLSVEVISFLWIGILPFFIQRLKDSGFLRVLNDLLAGITFPQVR